MDKLESVTLGNIPESNPALLSATVACYIVYSFALFLLYREFSWFTAHRHRFLSEKRPDNYTVYVKFIPPHLRSNEALLDYFRSIFGREAVLDARIAYEIPSLEKAVADRDLLCGTDERVGKLEHAINVLDVKGQRPRHKKIIVPDVTKANPTKGSGCSCGPPAETVDSIDDYTTELDALNTKIAKLMDDIDEKTKSDNAFRDDLEAALRKNLSLNDDESVTSGASMQFGVQPAEEEIVVFTDHPESALERPMQNEESAPLLSILRPSLLPPPSSRQLQRRRKRRMPGHPKRAVPSSLSLLPLEASVTQPRAASARQPNW